jgi:tight adherence protein C
MDMVDALSGLLGRPGNEWLLLGLVFLAAAALAVFAYLFLRPAYRSDRAIRTRVEKATHEQRVAERRTSRVSLYYEQVQEKTDTLAQRLQKAGFYGRDAIRRYYLIKYLSVILSFFVVLFLFLVYAPFPMMAAFAAGCVAGGLFYILPNLYLNRRAKTYQQAYRRAFPDFMDMMIVCADAGLSLEAAASRVARELDVTSPELGLHLEVMNLEMRAGRPMREALHNLARRTGLAEARTLAVLFQQSEELGTSLVGALRVYSEEMRVRRMTIAEEKANALPVKMLLPLGGCIFPVILIVVLLPVVTRLMSVLK